MRGEEDPAPEVVVVLLLAVVRQRVRARLAAGNPAPVGEGGHEQRVDGGHLAQGVDRPFGALVHERDGADLDAGGDRGIRGGLQSAAADEGGAGSGQGRALYESPASHHLGPPWGIRL
jgi:hypothetical protein